MDPLINASSNFIKSYIEVVDHTHLYHVHRTSVKRMDYLLNYRHMIEKSNLSIFRFIGMGTTRRQQLRINRARARYWRKRVGTK